jgi:hypothetical protein
MAEKFRYGDFAREVSLQQNEISYNALSPKIDKDKDGNDLPYTAPKVDVNAKDIYRILGPYVNVRLVEQLKAVIPLALYLVIFQLFILRQSVEDALIITGGLAAVITGLMFFMEGLKLGLMPFGEAMGSRLPKKLALPWVLFVAFLLGIGVTFAEPAIGALQKAGEIVDPNKAAYLFALLSTYATPLKLVVGVGVGFAAVLGTLRFVYNWSLKPLIYMSLVPTILITGYVQTDPELMKMIGLAWDCGAVTTGPVTVPLVLALGIGVASAVGKGSSSLSGFGIVTLASLFPIVATLILALVVSSQVSVDQVMEGIKAAQAAAAGVEPGFLDKTPWNEIFLAVQAIVPLVIFLVVVMKVVLREKINNAGLITYGIVLAVVGMALFNVGLTYGLAKLGEQSGRLVPAAFAQIEAVANSPLYMLGLGIFIAIAFAWFLGFGSTLAEPALNALGMTVQNLTHGAFRKSMLMYAVSAGVACGIALGVAKIIFDWQLVYMIFPGYLILLILTYFSTEEFVNVAWDSAGVTTGPVTVPLVLAMGLGFANASGAIEGFGILSLASVCPIISVLSTGLFIQYQTKKSKSKEIIQQDLEQESAS